MKPRLARTNSPSDYESGLAFVVDCTDPFAPVAYR